MSAFFDLHNVGMKYGERAVLSDVTLRFDTPELATIVGPNGAGKSTLLGIMAGLRRPYSGQARFRDHEVSRWRRDAFARRVSFVPQSVAIEFPFTAGQVVMMGRASYGSGLFESADDRRAAEQAMAITDTQPFRDREFRTLSGGERQRVILAAALAQEPQVLLLDEPTTFLDLKHQIAIYRLLSERARAGMLVVTVTHDLHLAGAYSDRVLMMEGGRVRADGAPQNTFTTERLKQIFDVACDTSADPATGRVRIHYGA